MMGGWGMMGGMGWFGMVLWGYSGYSSLRSQSGA